MTPLETVMTFMKAMERKDYDSGLQYVANDLATITDAMTKLMGGAQ